MALGEKTHPSVVCITLFANDLGESLHWDAEGGLLYWIDAWKGVVHSYDPATDRMRQTGFADALGGRPIGSIACGDGGGMISGVRGGFYELDPATGDARFVATVETDRPATNRLNDGKCDRAGRFWCASINTDHHTPSGALWRLNQECDPVMVQDGLIAGNGIAWSPDSRSMYLADTIAGRYGDTTSISRQGRSRTGDSSSPSTPLAALPMALPWMRTATTGPRSSRAAAWRSSTKASSCAISACRSPTRQCARSVGLTSIFSTLHRQAGFPTTRKESLNRRPGISCRRRPRRPRPA